MPSLFDQLVKLATKMAAAPLPRPKIEWLAPEKCLPSGVAGQVIRKDQAYFSIRVNEIFLHEGRHLWKGYEPMVLVMTEFVYGGTKTLVPFVVGPNLLKNAEGELPHGLVYKDILVAGPHPFRGGNVGISLILYKIKRKDYAKGLLQVLEGVSSAVGMPADMAMLTKVGKAVLDGLGTLLNMQDTVPVVGHRMDIDTSSITGFTSGYCLLSTQGDGDFSQVQVQNGQLIDPLSPAAAGKAPMHDYVLYSVHTSSRRGDETTLSFYPLQKQAREAILSAEEGWTRAKSMLLTLYQHMLNSDDLISAETEELFEKFKTELLAIKTRREQVTVLSETRHRGRRTKETRLDSRTAEILSL
jgi:hypothetical protein